MWVLQFRILFSIRVNYFRRFYENYLFYNQISRSNDYFFTHARYGKIDSITRICLREKMLHEAVRR